MLHPITKSFHKQLVIIMGSATGGGQGAMAPPPDFTRGGGQ